MHLEAHGLLPVMPLTSEDVMGTYSFQAVLKPDQYSQLVDSGINVSRPPFVKFSFKDLATEGYSLLINSKWCPSLGYTKLVVRAVKPGDHASVSIQFWIHRDECISGVLSDADRVLDWIEEYAWTYGGNLTCKNISNRGERMAVVNDPSRVVNAMSSYAPEFSPGDWMREKTIDEVLGIWDSVHPQMTRGKYIETMVEAGDREGILEYLIENYREHEFVDYFNAERSKWIKPVQTDETPAHLSDEEAIESLAVDPVNDNEPISFEEMLEKVFGKDAAEILAPIVATA